MMVTMREMRDHYRERGKTKMDWEKKEVRRPPGEPPSAQRSI